MTFVAGEIAVWMVLAFLVGMTVGWLARARRGGSGGGRSGGGRTRRRTR